MKPKTCSCGNHLISLCPLCDSDFDATDTILADYDRIKKELVDLKLKWTREPLSGYVDELENRLDRLRKAVQEHIVALDDWYSFCKMTHPSGKVRASEHNLRKTMKEI